jgi:hypothetical protein
MSILLEIRDAINEKYGKRIEGKTQMAEVNILRKAYCNALRPYYTLYQLGESVNRNHSSIIHYARNHDEDMKLAVYKSAYLYVKTLYNEKTMAMTNVLEVASMIQGVRAQLLKLERVLQTYGPRI